MLVAALLTASVAGGSPGVALGISEPSVGHNHGVSKFDRSASLLDGGRSVRVGGPTGCHRGERIFLTVRITHGNRAAAGVWSKHVCTGKVQHWSLIARVTTAGRSLRAGSAIGHGVALFKHNGRTVATDRWTAHITLR